MVKVLIIMHHIALCTPCIALVNGGHLLHMRVDHEESGLEFEAEQVQWVFRGPQASSGEDTNIAFGSRQAPVHLINALVFYFKALLYDLLDCVLSL
jgi:hypothetical protein